MDEQIGKIGIGYFSSVYRGTWRRRAVAIKVLAATTPRELFTHEAAIWKGLSHPNVLPLYGASSASGEPPWFFVSPYFQRGSIVKWLKGLSADAWGALLDDASHGVLRMVHEIAEGMAYLHSQGVLHGDLKVS